VNYGGTGVKKDEKKEVIKAIHYKEVQDFLNFVKSYERLEVEFTCSICMEKITAQNFKAAIRLSGKILFCCDKPECYKIFTEITRR
jgi:DNA helicase IV